MESLDRVRWPALWAHLIPDRPGPLIGLHAIHTGCGECWVDRWPGAHTGVVFTGGNLTCWGDPDALAVPDLAELIQRLLRVWDRVLIEVPPGFEVRVRQALPESLVWPRVILVHEHEPRVHDPSGAALRRLTRADIESVKGLDAQIEWISDTYGGAAGLAESATAWGAFVDGALVSVAASARRL